MKIIAMVPTFNDEDIIEEVIEHLISQGLELVILDNGSTDGTYEICKKFENSGILKLRRFITPTHTMHWDLILRALYDMALYKLPNWVIRCDSDEILETGVKGLTLKEGITEADAKGYNLIQFDRFDFFMTDNDNESAKSIKEKLTYYSYHGDFLYRSWKYSPGITIGYAGGHYPIFPDGLKYKISPKKFVMRHYTFRSKEHAVKKMNGKIRGLKTLRDKKGFSKHNKNIIRQDYKKLINHNILDKYEEDNNWNYEMKYTPYMPARPQTREEIFTKDGLLKNKHKSQIELQEELNNLNTRFFRKLLHRK